MVCSLAAVAFEPRARDVDGWSIPMTEGRGASESRE